MGDGSRLSPVKAQRRARIVAAAERVFLRDGFRGATMEAIAAEAALSKVTLYGYFRDKEAAFAAVAGRLAEGLEAGFMAALGTGLPLAERITDALAFKHRTVHSLLSASPHAAELMAARAGVAQTFAALDDRLRGRLAVETGDPQLARILFDGALGLAGEAADMTSFRADLARLVRGMLGAV